MKRILLLLFSLLLLTTPVFSQPSITIVSPQKGEKLEGTGVIKVEAANPEDISRIEFYIDNTKVGEVNEAPFEYKWDTMFYPNGEHKITVRAYDKKGNMTGLSINVKVENASYKGWQKTYGGSDDDVAHSIQQTSDGGYIVAGGTESFGAGEGDVYIIKLDRNGNKVWEKTYGGSDYDVAESIQQTGDGGYIVARGTESLDAGGSDVYIIKMDSQGNTGPYPLTQGDLVR